MKIALIAAMAKNRVIGLDNQMPWHLPADLKHFKQVTLGSPVVMGRKTYESIGRPLPKRRNIVISRQQDLQIPGVEIFHSMDSALAALQQEERVMVIGGQTLFEQALEIADKMYLTFIDLDVDGDTFFPAWDEAQWQVVASESHQAEESNPHDYQFVEYVRL